VLWVCIYVRLPSPPWACSPSPWACPSLNTFYGIHEQASQGYERNPALQRFATALHKFKGLRHKVRLHSFPGGELGTIRHGRYSLIALGSERTYGGLKLIDFCASGGGFPKTILVTACLRLEVPKMAETNARFKDSCFCFSTFSL
jgi:hypothetical protein